MDYEGPATLEEAIELANRGLGFCNWQLIGEEFDEWEFKVRLGCLDRIRQALKEIREHSTPASS